MSLSALTILAAVTVDFSRSAGVAGIASKDAFFGLPEVAGHEVFLRGRFYILPDSLRAISG